MWLATFMTLELYFATIYEEVSWATNKNGGGPQGATIGILEYLSQPSKSFTCEDQDEIFEFEEDFSILEIVYLLTSHKIKSQVSSGPIFGDQFISPDNLKSQKYLVIMSNPQLNTTSILLF